MQDDLIMISGSGGSIHVPRMQDLNLHFFTSFPFDFFAGTKSVCGNLYCIHPPRMEVRNAQVENTRERPNRCHLEGWPSSTDYVRRYSQMYRLTVNRLVLTIKLLRRAQIDFVAHSCWIALFFLITKLECIVLDEMLYRQNYIQLHQHNMVSIKLRILIMWYQLMSPRGWQDKK